MRSRCQWLEACKRIPSTFDFHRLHVALMIMIGKGHVVLFVWQWDTVDAWVGSRWHMRTVDQWRGLLPKHAPRETDLLPAHLATLCKTQKRKPPKGFLRDVFG